VAPPNKTDTRTLAQKLAGHLDSGALQTIYFNYNFDVFFIILSIIMLGDILLQQDRLGLVIVSFVPLSTN
jgi:hypothetical protein